MTAQPELAHSTQRNDATYGKRSLDCGLAANLTTPYCDGLGAVNHTQGERMNWKANALAAYGKVANAETDPLQQIVMLYDGAIKFLRLAAADIEAGNLTAKGEHTNRALDIIGYLQSILDYQRGGEVAPILNTLYLHVAADTLRASAQLDSALLRQTAELLTPVRNAWASNAKTSVPVVAAVPQHAQLAGACLV